MARQWRAHGEYSLAQKPLFFSLSKLLISCVQFSQISLPKITLNMVTFAIQIAATDREAVT